MERFKLAVSSGEPVNPPIWWIAPNDKIAQRIDDEFLLGDKILSAPIVVQGWLFAHLIATCHEFLLTLSLSLFSHRSNQTRHLSSGGHVEGWQRWNWAFRWMDPRLSSCTRQACILHQAVKSHVDMTDWMNKVKKVFPHTCVPCNHIFGVKVSTEIGFDNLS